MELNLNPSHPTQTVKTSDTESYMLFRTAIPKPIAEEKHLRHILRFYIARAMQKRGMQEIYVLPHLQADGQEFTVDVMGTGESSRVLAICEPESVTAETEAILNTLRGLEGIEVIIVHSRYGNPGNVMEAFKAELESKKFRLLAVVPPPFDDVYEYDIWMFETTFRDLFEEGA